VGKRGEGAESPKKLQKRGRGGKRREQLQTKEQLLKKRKKAEGKNKKEKRGLLQEALHIGGKGNDERKSEVLH